MNDNYVERMNRECELRIEVMEAQLAELKVVDKHRVAALAGQAHADKLSTEWHERQAYLQGPAEIAKGRRNYFANGAMNGLLIALPDLAPNRIAERAFEIADAMLKQTEVLP